MEVVPKNEKKEHKKELYRHKKMQYYITKSRTTELVYFSSLFLPSLIITSWLIHQYDRKFTYFLKFKLFLFF